jgi:exodeoxyribonuclease VII small subunit
MPKKNTDLNFEEALSQLDEIVKKLENGQLPLDKAIDEYEKSVALIKHCENILSRCEKRISVLQVDKNGDLKEESFQIPEA